MDVVNTIKANAKEYKIEDADAEDRIAELEKEVEELKDSLDQVNQSLLDFQSIISGNYSTIDSFVNVYDKAGTNRLVAFNVSGDLRNYLSGETNSLATFLIGSKNSSTNYKYMMFSQTTIYYGAYNPETESFTRLFKVTGTSLT